jgi:hypothetical protein
MPPGQPFSGLQKRNVELPFAQGVDQKTDPLQLKPGSLSSLVNAQFNKAGRLDKRNGFGSVTTVSPAAGQQITAFNNGTSLIAYGPNSVQAYDQGANSWYTAGSYIPMSVNTEPVLRPNSDVRQGDIAFDPSTHRYCAVVQSWTGNAQYQVFDKANVAITPLTTITGTWARVNIVGTNFVITYHDGTNLRYIAIPIATPNSPGAPVLIQANCYSGTALSGSKALSGVSFATFEYGFSSNQYTIALLNNGTHGFETAYWQGDNNGDGTHVDVSVSMVTTVSTQNDIQAAINNTPSPPSSPQGSSTNNALYTNTAGTTTVASAAAAAFTGGSNPNHDVFVASDGNMYGVVTLSAGTLQVFKLTSDLVLTSVNIAAANASLVSITEDAGTGLLYVTWVTVDSLTIKCATYNHSLVQQTAPTTIVTQGLSTVGLVAGFPIMSLTSIASGGACRIVFQNRNWYKASQAGVTPPLYFLTASERTDLVQQVVVNANLTINTALAVLKRGVGLASKPVIFNGVGYVAVNYQSPLEPTNFLIDFSGNVLCKMGNQKSINTSENGCGWYLPKITSTNVPPDFTKAGLLIPHLIIDQLISVSKTPGTPFPTGIFSFAGLNFDILQFNLSTASHAEIANVMHLAGGFPWMYDGSSVVEHGFHVYPDVLLISSNGGTPGAAFTQFWYAVYEWMDAAGNIHKSAPSFPIEATIKNSGGNFTFFVPTLRLTAKIGVQICLYRWSQSQPTPYFVASVANNPTVDFVGITDTSGSSGSDSIIAGNRTLYTWGGELENISAPACIAMSMFRARLFVVSSEDQNQLFFTKQCIEGVPAEFADGFSLFIAPTISSTGPTGFVQALYPLDDKLIIFKQNAIYYIVGNGPDNTGQFDDFSDPIFITAAVGCSNLSSAVMIPDGVMFQSTKGIWILGRDLSTNYIGAPVEDYTNGHNVVSVDSIPTLNQVRFAMDNGNILVYDYFFKQWGVFILANGSTPQDTTIWNNLHTILDTSGNVFQETPGTYQDGGSLVAMSFTTSWYALQGIQGYQRAYWFTLLGTQSSAHQLNCTIDYDYGNTPSQVVGTITADGSVPEQWRVFLTQQKCQSFRVTLTEVPTVAGAGLTLSGLNLWIGGKFGQYPRLKPGASIS